MIRLQLGAWGPPALCFLCTLKKSLAEMPAPRASRTNLILRQQWHRCPLQPQLQMAPTMALKAAVGLGWLFLGVQVKQGWAGL